MRLCKHAGWCRECLQRPSARTAALHFRFGSGESRFTSCQVCQCVQPLPGCMACDPQRPPATPSPPSHHHPLAVVGPPRSHAGPFAWSRSGALGERVPHVGQPDEFAYEFERMHPDPSHWREAVL